MKIILYLCFLTLSLSLFAQKGIISGSVKFKDGTPTQLASVYIENSSNNTYTNEDGSFELKAMPYGEYVVNIKYFGKTTETVSVNLNRETLVINHSLNFSEANELDEILVKVKTEEAKIETNGFAVNAIKVQEMALQSVQATDILDRSSGVRIRQTGGLGSHTHYNINGLSGNAIRIFIDGSPIQSFGPSFSLSSIPPNMIDRIEVYKGVVPIELAGDALGGAINVVLKEDFNQNTLSTSYSYGSFNTHQATVSGNAYNKKTGFTLRGSGFYNYSDNDYEVYGNQVYTTNPTTGDITYVRAKRFHDAYSSGGFKIDAGVSNRTWADELLVGAVYSTLDNEIQHGATMESVYGNRKMDQQTKLISLSYKDASFLNEEKLNLELFSSYSDLRRRLTDTVPYIYDWGGKRKERFNNNGDFIGYYEYFSGAEAGNPTLQRSDEDVFVGRATTNYTINDNHSISSNFFQTRFKRGIEDPLEDVDLRSLEDTRYSNKSIFGLGYNFKAFDSKLKTSLFYKHFNQNIQSNNYSKRDINAPVELNTLNRTLGANGFGLTVAYQILPNILIQASAENSFRLPTARELFGNLAENLEPNYNLEPEKSKNLNLGVTLGTFSFGKHETKIKINTFIRDTKDKIKRNVREDDTDETTEFINDDSYLSQGFDVDIFYSYNRTLDFSGNVSVFNSLFNTQFDETGLEYNWYRDRERNAPFFTANGNLQYTASNLLQNKSQTRFSTNLSYVHWFYRDWESLGGAGKDIIPTQLVSDIGIAHTFPDKKITIAFDARNILDKQVFDNYALQKPGRAFYMKINYTIF